MFVIAGICHQFYVGRGARCDPHLNRVMGSWLDKVGRALAVGPGWLSGLGKPRSGPSPAAGASLDGGLEVHPPRHNPHLNVPPVTCLHFVGFRGREGSKPLQGSFCVIIQIHHEIHQVLFYLVLWGLSDVSPTSHMHLRKLRLILVLEYPQVSKPNKDFQSWCRVPSLPQILGERSLFPACVQTDATGQVQVRRVDWKSHQTGWRPPLWLSLCLGLPPVTHTASAATGCDGIARQLFPLQWLLARNVITS